MSISELLDFSASVVRALNSFYEWINLPLKQHINLSFLNVLSIGNPIAGTFVSSLNALLSYSVLELLMSSAIVYFLVFAVAKWLVR